MRLLLDAPEGFDFRRTAASHGWGELLPFRLTPDYPTIRATVSASGAWPIVLSPKDGKVALTLAGGPKPSVGREIERAARRILNLDLDLDPFYAVVSADPRFTWIASCGVIPSQFTNASISMWLPQPSVRRPPASWLPTSSVAPASRTRTVFCAHKPPSLGAGSCLSNARPHSSRNAGHLSAPSNGSSSHSGRSPSARGALPPSS